MITFRPYENKDAETIASWIPNEKAFRLWCADRFKNYPLTAEEFNNIYKTGELSGLVAQDGNSVIGHLFMQNLGQDKYKFGLIIIDSSIRGKGYGKSMLLSAIDYAKQKFGAKVITLSVFDNNVSAFECYKKLGFSENGKYTEYNLFGQTHKYIELEYITKKAD